MSENDTEFAEAQFDSKEAFFEAVKESGAVLGEMEYFTEGSGSATSYKARTDDGKVNNVKKSDVEAAWDDAHGAESEGEEEDEAEEVHLGTFYYASAWEEEKHLPELKRLMEEEDWKITGEVSSGGYRISSEE